MSGDSFDWRPHRIVVGFDGTAGAKDAVELCRTISAEDTHVALVDVLLYPGAPSAAYRLVTGAEFPIPEDFFAPATSRLPGRRLQTLTFIGNSPARILQDLAVEEGFDLIVVGSPHRGRIGRIMAGSVARTLLHGSPVPVITAPHGYADSAPTDLAKIAVAYDGGEESRAALAYAQEIGRAAGATVEVLTVERPTDPVRSAIAYTFSLPEDVDEIQRQALGEVDPRLDLRRQVLQGETAEALLDACAQDVDLLVVGSRGYGTVERVLLGSTSAAVIDEAPCPVLVAPRPPAGH
ncbi:MAG: universal stress protein [Solirubrobacterales bacterium]